MQLSHPPVLCGHASAFFMLNHNGKQHLSLTRSPSPSGRHPLQADHQPRALLPTQKEEEGQHVPGGLRALRLLSKYSQQYTVISCVSGPLTPLNLENQADFSRQQSAPRHIEP